MRFIWEEASGVAELALSIRWVLTLRSIPLCPELPAVKWDKELSLSETFITLILVSQMVTTNKFHCFSQAISAWNSKSANLNNLLLGSKS